MGALTTPTPLPLELIPVHATPGRANRATMGALFIVVPGRGLLALDIHCGGRLWKSLQPAEGQFRGATGSRGQAEGRNKKRRKQGRSSAVAQTEAGAMSTAGQGQVSVIAKIDS